MSDRLLEGLNPQQREAVLAVEHPLLIVAGVGSGKTRVITHKMAYLVVERSYSPAQVLGVTFTNRAADEMKGRVEALTGMSPGAFPVYTFHALGLRLLREAGGVLGFDANWYVVDDKDQKKILDSLIGDLDEAFNKESRDAVRRKINQAKMKLRYPNDLSTLESMGFSALECKIFLRYHEFQRQNRIWDYEDLVSFAVRLLQHAPDVKRKFQQRFRYLLVDEFQDTNPNQYELIRLLAGEEGRITVVGDDDQAIYSWRGADVRYLFDFERDFPGTRVITLEQNYRSTQPILNFANALISQNRQRRDKRMWTENRTGKPVIVLHSQSREDEADIIAQFIKRAMSRGEDIFPLAILYRINSQSLSFENEFLQRGIAFTIVKGMRFFERREIKDALALLRLSLHPGDDYAFRRTIDFLPLGIGPKTLQRIETAAEKQKVPLYTAYKELYAEKWPRIPLFRIMETLYQEKTAIPFSTRLETMLTESGYLKKLKDRKDHDRIMNLEELVGFIKGWEDENPDGNFHQLLDRMSLHATESSTRERARVFLLTMHNAKGTEFRSVVVAGINDAYMPFFLREGDEELQEERRLFYVAATRAIDQLIVSVGGARPSSFIRHMERGLSRRAYGADDIWNTLEAKATPVPERGGSAGTVAHPVFGAGTILRNLGGRRYLIDFENSGEKIIDASLVSMIFNA